MSFWNDPSILQPKQLHRWVISFSVLKEAVYIPSHFVKSVDRPSYEMGMYETKILYSHQVNFPKRLKWKPITIVLYDVENAKPLPTEKVTIIDQPSNAGPMGIWDKDSTSVTKPYTKTVKKNIGGGVFIDEKVEVPAKKNWKPQEFSPTTESILYYFLQRSGHYPLDNTIDKAESLSFESFHFKNNLIKTLLGETTFYRDSSDVRSPFMQIKQLSGNGQMIDNWVLYNPFIYDIKADKLDYGSGEIGTITISISYDWAKLSKRDQTASTVPPPQDPYFDLNDLDAAAKKALDAVKFDPEITRNAFTGRQASAEDTPGLKLPPMKSDTDAALKALSIDPFKSSKSAEQRLQETRAKLEVPTIEEIFGEKEEKIPPYVEAKNKADEAAELKASQTEAKYKAEMEPLYENYQKATQQFERGKITREQYDAYVAENRAERKEIKDKYYPPEPPKPFQRPETDPLPGSSRTESFQEPAPRGSQTVPNEPSNSVSSGVRSGSEQTPKPDSPTPRSPEPVPSSPTPPPPAPPPKVDAPTIGDRQAQVLRSESDRRSAVVARTEELLAVKHEPPTLQVTSPDARTVRLPDGSTVTQQPLTDADVQRARDYSISVEAARTSANQRAFGMNAPAQIERNNATFDTLQSDIQRAVAENDRATLERIIRLSATSRSYTSVYK